MEVGAMLKKILVRVGRAFQWHASVITQVVGE